MFETKESPRATKEKIEYLQEKLKSGKEEDYIEVFNKMGNTSQLEYIVTLYKDFIKKFSNEGSDDLIRSFLEINGLESSNDENVVVNRLTEIQNKINSIGQFITNCTNALRITDKNNDVIVSASPKDAIITKLENECSIVSAPKLRELQTHFTKIDYDKSSDEFQSRQGKLKDKSLYKLSTSEQETLSEIGSRINIMYTYVRKQLDAVQHEMKDSLEELKRIIGLNSGLYWTFEEGHSGLTDWMQIRILEYMTGRPHYTTENLEKAFEKIKKSPYSGISSSSVFHNKIGWHAQYISDIAPVKVKENGEEKIKEVLFHDNTWGASEYENTWTDSYGLKRTDYSDSRGGELGYITNEEFQNGNFVERILREMVVRTSPDRTENKIYKKIKLPNSEGIKTPQYESVILDGRSPEIKNVADQIHDTIFAPSSKLIELIKVLAEKNTEEELKSMFTSITGAGKSWKSKYKDLLRRIFPITGNGIETLEDYNNLSNNDYLKVALEKVAIKQSGQIAGLEPELAKIRDIKGLSKFKAAQKIRALNSFKYAFGKTTNIIDYIGLCWGEKQDSDIERILDKYDIKLSEKEIVELTGKFYIDMEKFTGSTRDSKTR